MSRGFVGRTVELATLRGHLDRAASGATSPVVIEGPAGIGKTALISRFIAGAGSAVTPLIASGARAEQDVAGGIADQLLRSVPPNDARPGAGDSDLGPRLLGTLEAASRRRPLIVAVDDAQWTDEESLSALLFAVRRLRSRPVLTLLVTRPPEDRRLEPFLRLTADDPAFHLRLAGLAPDVVAVLARTFGMPGITRGTAARLVAHTGGNPRHLTAVLQENPPAVLHAADPLPAPRALAAGVTRALNECPAPGRALVAAAAVLGTRCSLAAAANLADLPDPIGALAQAGRHGLLAHSDEPGSGEVVFADPLRRAATYHVLSRPERRALHTRAAEVSDTDQRLAHRVAAAAMEDESLAADLSDRATADAARGERDLAATRWHLAAMLSPAPRDRTARTLSAVQCLLQAGEAPRAAELLEGVTADGGPRRHWLSGLTALLAGDLRTADLEFDAAWHRSTDPSLRAAIAGQRATLSALRLHPNAVRHWIAATPPATTTPDDLPAALLVTALAMTRRTREIEELLNRWSEARPDHWRLQEARGTAKLWADDPRGARADLTRARQHLRDRGMRAAELAMLPALCLACFRCGEWSQALEVATDGLVLAGGTPMVFASPALHCCAALVHAGRGDPVAAQRHLALADAATSPPVPIVAAIRQATAVYLGCWTDQPGLAVDAAAEVEALADRTADADGPDPSRARPALELLAWPAMAADALIAVGRAEDAREMLTAYRESATDLPSTTAAICRVAGRMHAADGEIADARGCFERGIAAASEAGWPHGRAMLELELGALLRRAGRRTQAANHLTAARDTLSRLGATRPAQLADRELASCGLRPSRRDGSADRALTPAEWNTARLAAAGRTNRQIAEELVISVKTVEFHLGRVFRKLDVTSRRRLAARLDSVEPDRRDDTAPPPGGGPTGSTGTTSGFVIHASGLDDHAEGLVVPSSASTTHGDTGSTRDTRSTRSTRDAGSARDTGSARRRDSRRAQRAARPPLPAQRSEGASDPCTKSC